MDSVGYGADTGTVCGSGVTELGAGARDSVCTCIFQKALNDLPGIETRSVW